MDWGFLYAFFCCPQPHMGRMSTDEFFRLTYPQLKELFKLINKQADKTSKRPSSNTWKVEASQAVMRKMQKEARARLEAAKEKQ